MFNPTIFHLLFHTVLNFKSVGTKPKQARDCFIDFKTCGWCIYQTYRHFDILFQFRTDYMLQFLCDLFFFLLGIGLLWIIRTIFGNSVQDRILEQTRRIFEELDFFLTVKISWNMYKKYKCAAVNNRQVPKIFFSKIIMILH